MRAVESVVQITVWIMSSKVLTKAWIDLVEILLTLNHMCVLSNGMHCGIIRIYNEILITLIETVNLGLFNRKSWLTELYYEIYWQNSPPPPPNKNWFQWFHRTQWHTASMITVCKCWCVASALQKQNARIQNGTPLMSTLRSEGDPIAQSLQRINCDLAKVITLIGSSGNNSLQGEVWWRVARGCLY